MKNFVFETVNWIMSEGFFWDQLICILGKYEV